MDKERASQFLTLQNSQSNELSNPLTISTKSLITLPSVSPRANRGIKIVGADEELKYTALLVEDQANQNKQAMHQKSMRLSPKMTRANDQRARYDKIIDKSKFKNPFSDFRSPLQSKM